jgi:hypothetical protein
MNVETGRIVLRRRRHKHVEKRTYLLRSSEPVVRQGSARVTAGSADTGEVAR